MKIHLGTYGLRYISGGALPEATSLEVPVGTTVESLARMLNLSLRDVGMIAVNGQQVPPERVLDADDEVKFFAFVEGG